MTQKQLRILLDQRTETVFTRSQVTNLADEADFELVFFELGPDNNFYDIGYRSMITLADKSDNNTVMTFVDFGNNFKLISLNYNGDIRRPL